MLKKTLIATFLLFTVTFAAYGQFVVSPTFGVGMLKGPDIHDEYSGGAKGTWKSSYSVGLGFDYFFMSYTAFITELTLVGPHKPEYYGKGNTYVYLTLPVGIRHYINDNIFLGGGLYCAYSLNPNLWHPMDNYGLFTDIGTSFHLSNGDMLLLYGRYKFGKYHRNSLGWERNKTGRGWTNSANNKWQSAALTLNIAYGFFFQ